MEIEENVLSLSVQLEEKDIEKMDIDEEFMVQKELSNKMDKKVMEKQQKNDESEKKWAENKLAREKSKKDNEKKIIENEKKMNKIQKQRSKDKRKRDAKKNKTIYGTVHNIKEVPINCKTFVNEGDKIYIVPGNGACAPNSAAVHLFQDESFGPRLRIKMNNFLADNYENYKEIFPCSEAEPFVRQLKGEQVIFNNPENLKKFLKTSQEAGFMWSDSEDLKILSDMYQLRIKIITTKGPTDDNPSVNWIEPDKNMEKFAELQNVDIREMVLFHENDIHFDLVVPGDSELLLYGNLSKSNITFPEKEEGVKEDIDGDTIELKNYKQEIGKLKKENEYLEKQYIECERALRKKTEEAERLKSEIKDIKLKISLENEIRSNVEETDSFDIGDLYKMKSSGFRRNDPTTESSPIKNYPNMESAAEEEL